MLGHHALFPGIESVDEVLFLTVVRNESPDALFRHMEGLKLSKSKIKRGEFSSIKSNPDLHIPTGKLRTSL